ncbi:hypothetical protein B7463_g3829, partial [Scytalidium lignicola]
MQREIWRPTLKHDSSTGVHFIVAHERESRSLVSRPIWASVEHPRLETRMVTVHEWLRECDAEHPGCKAQSSLSQKSVLPMRLLDVNQNGSIEYMVLVRTGTVRESLKYLALSHCWGNDHMPMRTTKQNVVDHENGLRINSLPRTFRDAVIITRLLGYKYIWIDSLCIVQDDQNDWEREASKMASIFHCADIVLSAASARNSSEGCGIDKCLEPATNFFFPSQLDYKYDTLAQTYGGPRKRLFIRRGGITSNGIEGCPVQKRGWILQEILLAQRVLYFVNGDMIWQCHHLVQSEDGQLSRAQTSSIFSCHYGGNLSNAPLYNLEKRLQIGREVHLWWDILRDFFQRKFTKSEDTLPSLAGLIDIWRGYTNDDSVLGLWKKDLPFHLCWFVGSSLSIVDRVPAQPSWCWTSVSQANRPILQHASWDYVSSEDVVWQAGIKNVDIQWEGRPLLSRPKRATLSLYRVRATRGALYQAISYLLDNEEEKEFKHPETVQIIPLIITKPSSATSKRTGGARFHMHSLLLERINLIDGQVRYRRKGYADFVSRLDCKDSDIDARVKEIISGIEEIDIIDIV